jgi:hypothetical protein
LHLLIYPFIHSTNSPPTHVIYIKSSSWHTVSEEAIEREQLSPLLGVHRRRAGHGLNLPQKNVHKIWRKHLHMKYNKFPFAQAIQLDDDRES